MHHAPSRPCSHSGPRRHPRRFVVSPWGEGPDCHRTWEALAAGCIPIVRVHPGLANLFTNEPVLTVMDWSELTPELLTGPRVAALPPRTTSSWLPHWVQTIMPEMWPGANDTGAAAGTAR